MIDCVYCCAAKPRLHHLKSQGSFRRTDASHWSPSGTRQFGRWARTPPANISNCRVWNVSHVKSHYLPLSCFHQRSVWVGRLILSSSGEEEEKKKKHLSSRRGHTQTQPRRWRRTGSSRDRSGVQAEVTPDKMLTSCKKRWCGNSSSHVLRVRWNYLRLT